MIMLSNAHKMYKLDIPIIKLNGPARMAPIGCVTIINMLDIDQTLPILARGTVCCITVKTIISTIGIRRPIINRPICI